MINISVETMSFYISQRRHTMSKLIKKVVDFFAKQPNALEAFIISKEPKTHSDVEFWTKYFEYRGL
jgi:uncharacterized protein YebE (UPF0316 family)